jgi:hypothetical protein
MSKYTKIFWSNLFSWKYYWLFLQARFKANFIDAPAYRRLMSILWALTTIGLLCITKDWPIYLVVWVIPTTIIYQCSALCQFSTEHLWGSLSPNNEIKSHARFCGENLPLNNSLKDWSYWWAKMLLYHLPVRVGILSAELINHDLHHLLPKEDKASWFNIIYARQQLEETGLVKSAEHWGIHNAANAVFQNLADQDPLTPEEIDRIINS